MLKQTLVSLSLLGSLILTACSGNGAATPVPTTQINTSDAASAAVPDSGASAAPADASDASITTESWRRRHHNDNSTPSPKPSASAPAPVKSAVPVKTPVPVVTPVPVKTAVPATPAPILVGGAWNPKVTDTWQWQLQGTVNTNYAVNVYDVDLYDTSQATINTLKSQGKHPVCYFSAGSSENWRPDFASFQTADMGSNLSGWPGERWLDTRSANVRAIMRNRFALAKSKGCDGVEPDNVDGYTNKPGFPLTAATQLDYNRFLADAAHAAGLRVALKNDVDQVSQLASSFDFAVNEQCNEYSECGVYTAFTGAGKPVFNAEYAAKYKVDATRATLCAKSKAANIRTLVLPLDLNDSFRYSCD